MKVLFKTSVMMIAATGIMVISAATALAAEPLGPEHGGALIEMEGYHDQLPDDEFLVMPDNLQEQDVLDQAIDEPAVDEPQPSENMDEACDTVRANGYNHVGTYDCGNPDTFDNPGELNVPQENLETPQPPATAETPQVPSSRLPNTGSHLLLVAFFGLGLAGVAFGVRRYALKRSR